MFGKLSAMAGDAIQKQVTEMVEANEKDSSSSSIQIDESASNVSTDFSGQRKALFVGINYFGTKAELRGCINDITTISTWLFTKGFTKEQSLILTDDQEDPSKRPTRENIINGMKWLVEGAASGDSLFFEYSGHGGTAKDVDADEEDSQDETICPEDYQEAGQILDDEMNAIMVKPLPKGCHLTCIYDSCHSGSALDLPFTYTVDGNLQVQVRDNVKAIMQAAMKAGMDFMKGDKASAMKGLTDSFSQMQANGGIGSLLGGGEGEKSDDELQAARTKMLKEKGTQADVVQLAGCKDAQTSADACIEGSHKGAMSFAFMKTMNENPDLSYTDLLKGLREILAGKYSQIPQMSTGKMTKMDCPFAI